MMQTYIIQGAPLGPVKIGRSINPQERIEKLNIGNPIKLRFLRIIDDDIENELHKRFADDRIRGEWFTYSKQIQLYINEQFPKQLRSLYSTVNNYCTNEERSEFNEEIYNLWVLGDKIKDHIIGNAAMHHHPIPTEIFELMECINHIPFLSDH